MKTLKFISGIFIVLTILIVSCDKKDNEEEPTPEPTKYEVVKVNTDFGDFMIWLYDTTALTFTWLPDGYVVA